MESSNKHGSFDYDQRETRIHGGTYNFQLFEIKQVVWVDWPLFARGKAGVGVKISPYKQVIVPFSSVEQARKFMQDLQKAVAESSVFPTSLEVRTSSEDIADQLSKLVQLRKDDVISEEEFQAGKRKLLS